MQDHTKKAIIEHAEREAPRECCGVIIVRRGKEVYIPCKNIAPPQDNHFIMDGSDYARAEDEGDVLSIVHSHINESCLPSQADMVSCEVTGVPWTIVSIPNKEFHTFEPTGYKAPLIGRVFTYGVLDCYRLATDYYREVVGIELRDFERNGEWWRRNEDYMMQNLDNADLVPIKDDDIQVHDLIFMQIGSVVANHVAIYLGDNQILHHVQNRLSCREVYGGFWAKHTRVVTRHRSLLGKKL